MVGYVRWFNPQRGYGFIDSGKASYFVFYKSVKMSGYRKLEPGQKVVFKIKNYKGYKQATHVRKWKSK